MINNINKSVLSGILIGLGVIINLQMQPPILGALLFSFGLITIINMQLNLFTGKIGFVPEYKTLFLFIMLLFNYIGIGLTVGIYTFANPDFVNLISAAAVSKFAKTTITLFINSIFCGMLIHFAVKNKNMIITAMAIIIFILIGAEHCIADFPYFMFNLSLINGLKLLSIIIGNSLGAILIERLNKTY